jgi:hypothetical protein
MSIIASLVSGRVNVDIILGVRLSLIDIEVGFDAGST